MPNSVIKVSCRMPLCGVSLERTVKRHIVNWMKKTSSRSHEKDQEELTCVKTNGGPFTTPHRRSHNE